MPTPPLLTQEQRRAAYERSLELRQARARLKELIKTGSPLECALLLEVAQGMRVMDLLLTLPGIGQAKARGLLAQAGITESKTVKGLGRHQVARLLALLT